MIQKFDSQIFNGNPELSFLHFKNDFEINLNINNIIFAFNGMCKTSISRYLAKKYSDQFFLINYEENKDSIKAIKAGKKIEILPDAFAFQKANMDLEQAKSQTGIFTRIENGFGLLKTKIGSNIEYLKNAKTNESISSISLTEDEFNEIDAVIKPIKYEFGNHFRELVDCVHKVNDEIDNMQQGIVKLFCSSYLAHLQVGEDPKKCPICNGDLEGGLRKVLNDRLKKLSSIVEPYFSEYLANHKEVENADFLNRLSILISKYKTNENKLCEYLMVNSFEDAQQLNILISNQSIKQSAFDIENTNLNTLASNLQASESFIKDFVVDKFNFKDVKYDSKKKGLLLTVPDDRPAASFSQGELNFITLMIRLTMARSTDKTHIILDDPLSSYDIPNQYRIMYEIVKYIRENSSKKIIIFTHNSDALNIAKQYNHSCNFKFSYIERYNAELSIEELHIDKNIINIENIINAHDHDGYLRANRDRENPLFNDPVVTKDQLNSIFHYDGSENSVTYFGHLLKNTDLISKIDTFSSGSLVNVNFITNTVNKVILLMSIRLFVEKKFLDISSSVKADLLSVNEFGLRLKKINDNYINDAISKYPNFNIDELKRMKVMLNQNEHYKSQVQPYYYAMNISLDELSEEIMKVKYMFS